MQYQLFSHNPMGQNVYLAWCPATLDGVIIDAGCNDQDAAAIQAHVLNQGITLKAILLTHGHYDHIIYANQLAAQTAVPIYCHPKEEPLLADPALNLSCRTSQPFSVTGIQRLEDGETFLVGQVALKVIHTPGHTAGGLCFYCGAAGILFAGDSLFKGSIGRTDFPTGDAKQLVKNIKAKLFILPEETQVLSGHGPATTIGQEKKSNPFF